jgi:hypothetical protein
MSSQFHWVWVGAMVWAVLNGPLMAAPAAPVVHHITVKVDVDSSNDFKDIAGSTAKSKVQQRQLTVMLDNRDTGEATDLTVKWMIFAHTMDKHKLVPVKEGTVKTKVEALKTAAVKSAMVTIRGTPKHSVVTKKSRKGKVQTSSKEHPATGEEYFGYSVEVYADAVLIDEIFSQPSLKPMK